MTHARRPWRSPPASIRRSIASPGSSTAARSPSPPGPIAPNGRSRPARTRSSPPPPAAGASRSTSRCADRPALQFQGRHLSVSEVGAQGRLVEAPGAQIVAVGAVLVARVGGQECTHALLDGRRQLAPPARVDPPHLRERIGDKVRVTEAEPTAGRRAPSGYQPVEEQ